MGFPDALTLLFKGATIQRSTWPRRSMVSIIDGVPKFSTGEPGKESAPFWASPEDMLASNWETVR